MTRDDIQKLLGGYATGTLTPEEQQALFAAALEDQDLFDALAREQSLHDLLRDPASRAHVLAALDERPEPWWKSAARWMTRPAGVGIVAACLAAVAGYGIWHARQPVAPILEAVNQPPKSAPAAQIPAVEPPQPEEPAPQARTDRPAARREVAPALPAPVPQPAAAAPPGIATGGKVEAEDAKKQVTVASNAAEVNTSQANLNQTPANQLAPTTQGRVQSAFQQSDTPNQQSGARQTAAAAPPPYLPPPAAPARAQAPALLKAQSDTATIDGPEALLDLSASRTDVPWTALRREKDGSLTTVAPDQIRARDAIVLRLNPYADGYLTVFERVPGSTATQTLVSTTRVDRGKPFDSPPVTLGRPGSVELFVQFTTMTRGTIGGRIVDPSGTAVGKTTVTLTNTGTNQSVRVQSNDTGSFEAPALLPGTYTVAAEAPGFKKASRSVDLLAADRREVDLTLEVGATTESVELRAFGQTGSRASGIAGAAKATVKEKREDAPKDAERPLPAGQQITLRYR